MADEQHKPGPLFSYPSMEKAPPSQPADQAGEFKYPGTDMQAQDTYRDPLAKDPEGYTTMDGRSPLDREEDALYSDLMKSDMPEAFNQVIDFVKEDLEMIGRHSGANAEDVQKDLQLVDTLRDFISRTPDPRWKAWAVGMADQIRKTKRSSKGKK